MKADELGSMIDWVGHYLGAKADPFRQITGQRKSEGNERSPVDMFFFSSERTKIKSNKTI